MHIHVKRICSREDGTFGVMLIDNLPICVTLELPWKDNQRRISCIPAGEYETVRVQSPRLGNTFMVKDVPNRSEILIHGAGTIADLLGCIGVGEFFHDYGGSLGVGIANPFAGAAMAEFRKRTEAVNSFHITISEHF